MDKCEMDKIVEGKLIWVNYGLETEKKMQTLCDLIAFNSANSALIGKLCEHSSSSPGKNAFWPDLHVHTVLRLP